MLHPNVVIRESCRIGDRVILHAGVVIGSDGFGYAVEDGARIKIPQIGIVDIGDDVEIGANSTVDRATLGRTVIGRGAKIDNLVQVAHNVSVGEDSVFAAQVGIAGSTQIGKNVTLAGQVGVGNHLEIGDGATIGPKSGVARVRRAGRGAFRMYRGLASSAVAQSDDLVAGLTALMALGYKLGKEDVAIVAGGGEGEWRRCLMLKKS